MSPVSHGTSSEQRVFHAGHPRELYGTALFVDVRRSSKIVEHIERHNGPGSAATFFMEYLTGCMHAITTQADAKCQPSGDAVLAVIEGPDEVPRAMAAATAAIQFVESEFEPENRDLLSCNGVCRRRHRHPASRRRGCDTMRLEVGVGIAEGFITQSRLSSNYGDSQELVGSCVSLAAKLSGWAQPSNAVAVTAQAYRKVKGQDERDYRWRRHITKLGGRYRTIMVTHPTRK